MRGANAATPSPAMTAAATAAADKNFSPGHACRIEELRGHSAHAARLGHRGKRQWLARAMLPAMCGEPAELFVHQDFPVVPPGVQADDHRVEFPPVETLQP